MASDWSLDFPERISSMHPRVGDWLHPNGHFCPGEPNCNISLENSVSLLPPWSIRAVSDKAQQGQSSKREQVAVE